MFHSNVNTQTNAQFQLREAIDGIISGVWPSMNVYAGLSKLLLASINKVFFIIDIDYEGSVQ